MHQRSICLIRCYVVPLEWVPMEQIYEITKLSVTRKRVTQFLNNSRVSATNDNTFANKLDVI